MITILFQLLHYLIEILRWVLIAQMIFSWLAAFNVLGDGLRTALDPRQSSPSP